MRLSSTDNSGSDKAEFYKTNGRKYEIQSKFSSSNKTYNDSSENNSTGSETCIFVNTLLQKTKVGRFKYVFKYSIFNWFDPLENPAFNFPENIRYLALFSIWSGSLIIESLLIVGKLLNEAFGTCYHRQMRILLYLFHHLLLHFLIQWSISTSRYVAFPCVLAWK